MALSNRRGFRAHVNHVELVSEDAGRAQEAKTVVVVGSVACSVVVHVGGDPVHAGLSTEPEKRKNVIATGFEVWSHFKQGAAEGQVEVQCYVGAQTAGGPREFGAEFHDLDGTL